MYRGDCCQFADVDPAGIVSNPCKRRGERREVPFLLHPYVLCQ
jgi:hypothetical protein